MKIYVPVWALITSSRRWMCVSLRSLGPEEGKVELVCRQWYTRSTNLHLLFSCFGNDSCRHNDNKFNVIVDNAGLVPTHLHATTHSLTNSLTHCLIPPHICTTDVEHARLQARIADRRIKRALPSSCVFTSSSHSHSFGRDLTFVCSDVNRDPVHFPHP
jgi:hypothetical protein